MEYLGSGNRRRQDLYGFRDVNLDSVTSATDGDSIDVIGCEKLSIFINVSVNTGAVTVIIEISPDGTDWYELDQKVYTAATGKDVYSYVDPFRFMRTRTIDHANATVKTTIIGRY